MNFIFIAHLSVFFTDFVLIEYNRIKNINLIKNMLRDDEYDFSDCDINKLYFDLKNDYKYHHDEDSSFCDFLYISMFPIANLLVLQTILFDKKYKEFNDNLVYYLNDNHLKENGIHKKKVNDNIDNKIIKTQTKNIVPVSNNYCEEKNKKKVRVLKK